jgi:hypothetical protein
MHGSAPAASNGKDLKGVIIAVFFSKTVYFMQTSYKTVDTCYGSCYL